jgi:uncharacterized protein (DUF2267 family)
MLAGRKLEKHAIYRDELMLQVAHQLKNVESIEDAKRIVSMVLRAIRNRLGFESSLRFLSLLPLPLKAIYVDGWIIQDNAPHALETTKDLVDEMMRSQNLFTPTHRDTYNAMEAIQAVFRVISLHVSRHEFEMMLEMMSPALKQELESKAYPYFNDSPDTSVWLS